MMARNTSVVPKSGSLKTSIAGTAEVPTTTCPNCADAWWAGWASEGGKSLVVVAFIHNGGHGGVSAAPVAASVFQSFFAPRLHYTFAAGTDQSR